MLEMLEQQTEDNLIFIDTTVQIDRIIGKDLRRNTIRRNLSGRRVTTSAHVLGEFNKTVLQDAVIFRNLVASSPNVGEAIKRLNKYGRSYSRTIELLVTLGFDNDKQLTLDRFDDFIEMHAHDQFWESIDLSAYTDEVGCILKEWEPDPDQHGNVID